ncbi:MAG TPA: CopD family protein [Burkholderiales bacterium]|nr:CopD family protein [Burkholderiales bacterium]
MDAPWRLRVVHALFVLLLSSAAGTAGAHTRLLAAEPAGGAVLDAAPARITLRYSTRVAPVRLALSGADGTQVPVTASAEGATLIVAPAFAAASSGVYTLRWRVAGADSHAVSGALSFRVGAGPPPAAEPPAAAADDDEKIRIEASPDHALLVALVLLRAVFVFAILAAAGAILFRLVIAESDGVPVRAIAVLGIAALAALHALMRGTIGAAATPLLGPALAVAGLAGMAASRRAIATAGVVLAIGGLALWGHASLGPPVVGQALFALHVAAAAFWAGSLWPLYTHVRRGERAGAIVARYSRIALWVVAALAAIGLALAWSRLGSAAAVVDSAYGRVLLVKIALFAVLACIALWNRLRLARRLPHSATALARTIDLELALMVLVVIAAAWLSALPPPAA